MVVHPDPPADELKTSWVDDPGSPSAEPPQHRRRDAGEDGTSQDSLDVDAGVDATALDVLVRRVQRDQVAPAPRWRALLEMLRTRSGYSGAGGLRTHGVDPRTSLPRGVAVGSLVVALLVGFLGWRFLARPSPIEDRMPVAGGGAASAAGGSAAGSDTGSGSGSPDARAGVGNEPGDRSGQPLTVHVAGSVLEAGLVELPAGSRVADAVESAGGIAPDADLERVNLAAVVPDGARIFIPAQGQDVPAELSVGNAGPRGEPTAEQPLDINTADAAALEELPGVGPATASAILEHRSEKGRFASVDALLDVRGIGEAKLESMRDLVTVG